MLEREGIDVKHCWTENTIADFLNKTLQGELFKRMRDIIMGHACFPTEELVDSSRKMTKMAVGTKSEVSTRKLTYTKI